MQVQLADQQEQLSRQEQEQQRAEARHTLVMPAPMTFAPICLQASTARVDHSLAFMARLLLWCWSAVAERLTYRPADYMTVVKLTES